MFSARLYIFMKIRLIFSHIYFLILSYDQKIVQFLPTCTVSSFRTESYYIAYDENEYKTTLILFMNI